MESGLYETDNLLRLARMLIKRWGDDAVRRASQLACGADHATRMAFVHLVEETAGKAAQ